MRIIGDKFIIFFYVKFGITIYNFCNLPMLNYFNTVTNYKLCSLYTLTIFRTFTFSDTKNVVQKKSIQCNPNQVPKDTTPEVKHYASC